MFNTLVAHAYPRRVTLDEDSVTFESFGRTDRYGFADIRQFSVREFPGQLKLYVRFGGMPDVDAELVINLGLLAHAEGQVAVLQALMNVFMCDEDVADIMAQDTAEGMVATMARWCEEKAE